MFEEFNNQCKPIIDQMDIEVIQFSPSEYGSDNKNQLDIHVHKLKAEPEKKRAAMIYFHGGGAVLQNPY